MKIRLYSWEDDYDYETTHLLKVNDEETSIGSLSECPEDAIIGRDLIDGNDIVRYMKTAYEAGKNGEEFDFELINKPPEGY